MVSRWPLTLAPFSAHPTATGEKGELYCYREAEDREPGASEGTELSGRYGCQPQSLLQQLGLL